MSKKIICSTLAVFLVSCSPKGQDTFLSHKATQVSTGIIYGEDSITEVETVNKYEVNKNASVALINKSDLQLSAPHQYKLAPSSVLDLYGTCSDLKLNPEAASSFCSGVLISPNIVLTAGHCVGINHPCEDTAFVFGYENDLLQSSENTIFDSQIYHCKKMLTQKDDQVNVLDFTLVQLDRNVPLFPAYMIFQMRQKFQPGTSIYTIGYPLGTPKKMAYGTVRSANVVSGAINADLDVFSGNSGGPVFDTQTNQLIGIISGGEDDFEFDEVKRCEKSRKCKDGQCSGEYIVPITRIMHELHKAKLSQ